MTKDQGKIGLRVRSNAEFADVPIGTQAVIINADGDDWVVEWELPDVIIRDWFSPRDMQYLDPV
jgi:hypothetical protein